MNAARALVPDDDNESLRDILKSSLGHHHLDDFMKDEDFDWSITLENIGHLSSEARTAREKFAAAELRAERAERKAAEALLWLRRLHQAVLNSMPPESTVQSLRTE